jgi:hypothetical protein
MTTTRPAEGPASRSGVRRSGDAYQDLIVWGAAMRVIGPDSRFTQVEMEITGAGNVDDVVLRSPAGDRYGQVKWATTTASLVDEQFMTASSGREKSLLQKLYASYHQLRAAGQPPVLELITNRTLDSTHPSASRTYRRAKRPAHALCQPGWPRNRSRESPAGVGRPHPGRPR